MSPYEGIPPALVHQPQSLIAGVDEVGRGSLFGPVFAAVVVLPLENIPDLVQLGVKDSKKLSVLGRQKMFQALLSCGCTYRLGYATAKEIDQLNILQASLLAGARAIKKLKEEPVCCLVDGQFPLPSLSIPQYTLVKGDTRSPLIAAASIIAKVFRDDLIIRFAKKYPQYGLSSHKGYPTAMHRQALQKYGASPQHRFSFAPVKALTVD